MRLDKWLHCVHVKTSSAIGDLCTQAVKFSAWAASHSGLPHNDKTFPSIWGGVVGELWPDDIQAFRTHKQIGLLPPSLLSSFSPPSLHPHINLSSLWQEVLQHICMSIVCSVVQRISAVHQLCIHIKTSLWGAWVRGRRGEKQTWRSKPCMCAWKTSSVTPTGTIYDSVTSKTVMILWFLGVTGQATSILLA